MINTRDIQPIISMNKYCRIFIATSFAYANNITMYKFIKKTEIHIEAKYTSGDKPKVSN